MKKEIIHKLGCIPDTPDFRDLNYSIKREGVLPEYIDFRNQCPPVYDQGQLGSCTANAIAAAMEFDLRKQHLQEFMPSRLFIYYNERAMEGTINSDSGAQIRNGIKSVNTLGVCPESEWKYNIKKFKSKPKKKCYSDALANVTLKYERINQTLSDMRTCLAEGFPFVAGISVYESFESEVVAKTGLVPMPKEIETLLGGHAILIVGYNDKENKFLCRNSWGNVWGVRGYFYLPYQYLVNNNLACDFWKINLIK